jgi:hypothetical protein
MTRLQGYRTKHFNSAAHNFECDEWDHLVANNILGSISIFIDR